MTSSPVFPEHKEAATESGGSSAWVAQDFAVEGQQFLVWFEALRATEPAFSWGAVYARRDNVFVSLAQTARDETRAESLARLVETAAANAQLKISVVQGGGASLTAMATPLAGTEYICVALLERKLVEATRLANLFDVSAHHLAQALLPKQSVPAGTPSDEAGIFSDSDLLDLLMIEDGDGFAEALFSRLSQAFGPDQALLALVDKERVQALRSTTALDPLPPGSRATLLRQSAVRAAARSAETIRISSQSETNLASAEIGLELVDMAREELLARAITVRLPARGKGHLIWLAAWDREPAGLDKRLPELSSRLTRLAGLLAAAHSPERRRAFAHISPWLDPRGWRLWMGLAMAGLSMWLLLPAPFHVIGEASLRSTAQQALVAPRDGFLSAVYARPGDIVAEGEVLAEFDTRELVLRQSRIEAQIVQAQSRRMAAMAAFNTAMVQIADAEIDAMGAERDLIALLLAQSRLVARQDAVVISGDMAERVGTAMRHGEPMFDLAPLDGFMVSIDLPQRDIIEVAPEQSGHLRLTALPFDSFPIELERISLTSNGETGAPGFTGLARLDATHEAFRAGMQGVVQIEVGQSIRAWVLLRDAVFWAQMQWWRWVP